MLHLLAILATWRIANMLWTKAAEDGPFDLLKNIRDFLSRWRMTGKMIECEQCCSVWAAGLVGILYALGQLQPAFLWPIYVLGYSGAVCILYMVLEMGWRMAGPERNKEDD